jgi:hypothetical protein
MRRKVRAVLGKPSVGWPEVTPRERAFLTIKTPANLILAGEPNVHVPLPMGTVTPKVPPSVIVSPSSNVAFRKKRLCELGVENGYGRMTA